MSLEPLPRFLYLTPSFSTILSFPSSSSLHFHVKCSKFLDADTALSGVEVKSHETRFREESFLEEDDYTMIIDDYLELETDDRTRRAPAPPQIEQTEASASQTFDVDSPHISSVPSDYSGETDTQAKRLEHEAQDAEAEAKKRFEKAEAEAKKDYKKGKEIASKEAAKSKAAAKSAAAELRENQDNPVVIGNAVVWTVIAATLG